MQAISILLLTLSMLGSEGEKACPFVSEHGWLTELAAVCLDMSLDELRQARPLLTIYPDSVETSLFTATEEITTDLSGHAAQALLMCGIRHERIAGILAICYMPAATPGGVKTEFLRFLLRSMGVVFKPSAITLNPASAREVQAPLLRWDEGSVRALAYMAEQHDKRNTPFYVFCYAVEIANEESGLADGLQEAELPEEALQDLFRKHEMPYDAQELQDMVQDAP
jgi:hypothetical protein